LLQSPDPAFENTFDKVECQIPQNFNNGSESILNMNIRSSRFLILEPTKEEKTGGRDFQAGEWIIGSTESQLRLLLRIELAIVMIGIVHGEHGARYSICLPPS
jgi:hypothetical protein